KRKTGTAGSAAWRGCSAVCRNKLFGLRCAPAFFSRRDSVVLLHLGAPESDHLSAEFLIAMAAADQRLPGCDPAFLGRLRWTLGPTLGPPFGHRAASGFPARNSGLIFLSHFSDFGRSAATVDAAHEGRAANDDEREDAAGHASSSSFFSR